MNSQISKEPVYIKNIKNKKNFLIAAECGIITLMILMVKQFNVNIYMTNDKKENAFLLAAKHGHLKIIKYLKNKYKYRRVYKTNKNNYDAYQLAIMNGHLDVMKFLDKHYIFEYDEIYSNIGETFDNICSSVSVEKYKDLCSYFRNRVNRRYFELVPKFMYNLRDFFHLRKHKTRMSKYCMICHEDFQKKL